MDGTADELLGAEHQRLLERLLVALDSEVRDQSKMVLLTGSSGAGKTRVIQELFRQLASRQSAPAYWPRDLLPAASVNEEPFLSRKVIAPDPFRFTWPAGALPSFAWWAFACERLRDGSLREPGLELRPDLNAHTLPLQLALAGAGSAWSRLAPALRQRAREALSEGGLEVAATVLGQAGLPVPGLGLLAKWVGASADHLRTQRNHRIQLEGSVNLADSVNSARSEQSRLLSAAIVGLSGEHLPAVVVVEDLHLASRELLVTLDDLLAPTSKNILVVANSWPEGVAHGFVAQQLEEWDQRRVLERLEMPILEFEDLATMASHYAPRTERLDLEWLIDTYPNPLALKLFMTLPSTQSLVARRDGAFRAPRSGVRIPRPIHDVYNERWSELPTTTQRSLALAAVVARSDGETSTGDFLPSVVVRGAERAGLLDSDSSREMSIELWRSASELGWLKRRSTTWSFGETLLGDTALEHAWVILSDDEIARVREGVKAILTEDVSWDASELGIRWGNHLAEPPSAVFLDLSGRVHRSRMLLKLVPEEQWGSKELFVPLLTHVAALASEGDTRESLRIVLGEKPFRHLPDTSEIRLELEREMAEWMVEQDLLDEALEVMDSVIQRRASIDRPGVDAALLHADLLGLLDRPREAWQEYEALSGWSDNDFRVEGVIWLLESQGSEVAEQFLEGIVRDAEGGLADKWVGVEAAMTLRRRAVRLGDYQRAGSLVRRAIRLTPDPVPEWLSELYHSLSQWARDGDIDKRLEWQAKLALNDMSTREAEGEGEPQEFRYTDWLDRDGRYDEAVPHLEERLAFAT